MQARGVRNQRHNFYLLPSARSPLLRCGGLPSLASINQRRRPARRRAETAGVERFSSSRGVVVFSPTARTKDDPELSRRGPPLTHDKSALSARKQFAALWPRIITDSSDARVSLLAGRDDTIVRTQLTDLHTVLGGSLLAQDVSTQVPYIFSLFSRIKVTYSTLIRSPSFPLIEAYVRRRRTLVEEIALSYSPFFCVLPGTQPRFQSWGSNSLILVIIQNKIRIVHPV